MGWVFLNFPSSSLLPACRKLQRKFNICLRPATQPPYINIKHKYSSRNSKQYCTIFNQINENRWNLDSFSPTPTSTTYLLNTDTVPIRREVAHRTLLACLWGLSSIPSARILKPKGLYWATLKLKIEMGLMPSGQMDEQCCDYGVLLQFPTP